MTAFLQGIRNALVSLTNRKFLSPFFALVASLIVAQPNFPLTEDQVNHLLAWIWAAGLGIPAADALYDQHNKLIDLVDTAKGGKG
jgi:hypothetical protein